jgi:hypothetical protein
MDPKPKPKRPIAVWIAVVLLVLNAIYVFAEVVYQINVLSYYAIPMSVVLERLGLKFAVTLISAFASLIAVVLIMKRSDRGRWLAILSLLAQLLHYLFDQFAGPRSEWRSIGTGAEFVVHSINLAFGIFPTALTIALLTIGERTNAYFRKAPRAENEPLSAEPPPPPVFDS